MSATPVTFDAKSKFVVDSVTSFQGTKQEQTCIAKMQQLIEACNRDLSNFVKGIDGIDCPLNPFWKAEFEGFKQSVDNNLTYLEYFLTAAK
jgi:hypothetical protein